MAEIIIPGKLPGEEWCHHHCMSCKCHFKFQRKEAKVKSSQREGEWHEIECPFCSKTCFISRLERYNPPTVDPY